MSHVWDCMDLPARVSVDARMVSDGTSVELVQSCSSSGAVSEYHSDDVLCCFFSPSHLKAFATYDERFPQTVGKLMFVPAGVANRVEGSDEHVSALLCRFDHEWLSRMTSLPMQWEDDHLRHCGNIRSSRASQAMEWLATEILNPGFASKMAVESLTSLIAVELTRYFKAQKELTATLSQDGRLTPKLLREIQEYVRFKSPCPTTYEIAVLCDCSAVHVRRLFKAATGQTLHKYIESIRLDRAMDLLAHTDGPVKEIARDLGFYHASGFAAVFRNAVGMTALEYRRLGRK